MAEEFSRRCGECGAVMRRDKRHKHEESGWRPRFEDLEGSLEGYEMVGLSRPWCCPEPRCVPVHRLANDDLAKPQPGESFVCFGRMGRPVAFEYDGSEHANDLRSCHYTPLKGLIANQENVDDWRMLGRAYATAVKAVAPSPQSRTGGDGP